MKAHEIFRVLSSAEVDQIVIDACQDDEIPDKIAGGVLTYQRIPLNRFERLSDETRLGYVRRTLRDKRGADLSLYVLSAALVQGKPAMISDFLDAVGLPHEGPNLAIEGEIPEPAPDLVAAAVDSLLAKYPARDVSIYLHAFGSQPDVHWKLLEEKLAQDEALKLEDLSAN
jgi:hypothetical protein